MFQPVGLMVTSGFFKGMGLKVPELREAVMSFERVKVVPSERGFQDLSV